MVDEDFQSGHRPTSQPFQLFQPVSWAQPSRMDFTTNNQLSRFTDGAAQGLTFEDCENITSVGTGKFDTSGLQQPVQALFEPPVMPQPSRLMDYSSNNQSIEFNPGTNEDLAIQDREDMMPITEGGLETTILSSGLQQSIFRPSIAPQTCSPAMNTVCSEQGPSSFMVPTDNQPQHPSGVVHLVARKRAPKAPTMSVKKWEPAEGRIRQLFVDEESTYKDVMDTVNKEFGFTATERQYKAKILQMKLKRNVEATKRTALIRHIQYRKDTLGKATKYVRVHGHRKTEAMVQHWMKEYPTMKWPTPCPPPSPLPSQISLRTRSRLVSPALSVLTISNKSIPGTESVTTNPPIDGPIKRLLNHAQGPNTIIHSEQCGAIFNDFQHILSAGIDVPKCPWHERCPDLEEDLFNVRNQMNLTRKIWLGKEFQELSHLKPSPNHRLINGSSKVLLVGGTWRTPYGRVSANFWRTHTSSERKSVEEGPSSQSPITARIAIHPNGNSVPLRIVLDLDPRLNPSARITYQATIPNNSEIFSIIEHGELEDLVRALENKTVSLTDRDEEGRSLLNYAKHFSRVDIVKFLLKNNFDLDAIELNVYGHLEPISLMHQYNTGELSEQEDKDILDQVAECYKLILEAGADFGIESHGNSYFRDVLAFECSTTLKHVIHLGGPFVHPYMLVHGIGPPGREDKCSPLIYLADISEYRCVDIAHVLEKAIILLKWGVEISCQDSEGNTVLHRVLCCFRKYRTDNRRPEKEPGELLKVFIAAGADVYALNKAGCSASRTARNFGREKEWSRALELCGFNSKEVINQTMPKHKQYTGPRQASRLTFEEYYRTWDEKKWAEKMSRPWEVDSEEEENWEEGYNNEDDSEDEDDSEEDDSEEDDESEDEESQRKRCCTQEATTVASRNTDGDSDDPIDNLASDHNNLRDEYHAEHGNGNGDPADHVNSLGMGIANTFQGMDHDGNDALRTTTWHSYDPMLNEEETESTNGSWRYDAMDHRRNLDQTSLAAGGYFDEMEATLKGTFRTDFDTFMTSG